MLTDHHAQNVPEIGERIRALKQHQLELIVEQRDGGSNLEIASVISYAAGEREANSKLTPLRFHSELRQPASHICEPAQPIGNFSQSVLELKIQAIDNFGIQPGAGH